ncbi:spherulin-1B [Rhypophila decipiens]|uniref:Spherulin-1B n=1 Tax=Rhypophila decipiens TaxID=261697 RepID=A0AAN6Y7A0_9PEZI|nr:spherulin-1B [Rhypophila decipiens]
MQSTSAIVLALLAYTSSVQATPLRRSEPALSLTQQLFIADTAVDRFALLPDDKQFLFDFNQKQANPGAGGEIIAANRKAFPALVGTGAGMAVGRLNACGMNTLHVHPRSAELQIVVQGRIVTEMVPENGVNDANGKRRVIRNEVGPFQMTPFYQGSVHTQFNPDCDPAVFIAAFPAEDFGTGQIADETFALSDDVIAATFGQSIAGADIDKVRQAIPINVALGVDECLKKCGIPKNH